MNATKRLVCLSGLVVAACALSGGTFETEAPAVFAAVGGASISDVMVVAHSGKMSIMSELKAAVKDSGPSSDKEWKAVKARGAVLASLATEILGKHKPKKGRESSWQKQVSAYASVAKKLAAAASDRDLAATSRAVKTLARSCSGCHKPHR